MLRKSCSRSLEVLGSLRVSICLPRIRQRHRDILRHRAGRGAQHDDALRDIERLIEIVGDEQDGQPEIAPELQQQVLQLRPASWRRAR